MESTSQSIPHRFQVFQALNLSCQFSVFKNLSYPLLKVPPMEMKLQRFDINFFDFLNKISQRNSVFTGIIPDGSEKIESVFPRQISKNSDAR